MTQLKSQLIKWASEYETPEFITSDPVQIPRRYLGHKCNTEISAFITAWIAWGSRSQIIKKADFIDRKILQEQPLQYILSKYWEKYRGDTGKIYRTFSYNDFCDLCARFFDVYTLYPDMEQAIIAEGAKYKERGHLRALQSLFGNTKGIPEKENAACKRLCLFLRWVCRGGCVDFGLWSCVKPENLIIPLDTHVHKQAIRLGITTRKTADILAAIEITDYFVDIFPGDPCRGDFALFGYGVNGALDVVGAVSEAVAEHEKNTCPPVEHLPVIEGCEPPKQTTAQKFRIKARHKIRAMRDAGVLWIPKKKMTAEDMPEALRELKVVDILKMQSFFDNVSRELTNIWNDRQSARRDAEYNGGRLKAHPLDDLKRNGCLVPGKFIVTYASILDKVHVNLPRAQRDVVTVLGNTAYQKTMQKLIDDERNKEKGNGSDR